MKHKRRKPPRRTLALAKTQRWDSQLQLPSPLARGLTSNQDLQHWATDIGMAVLNGLVEVGNRTAAKASHPSSQRAADERRARPIPPRNGPRMGGPSPYPGQRSRRPSLAVKGIALEPQQVTEGIAVGDLLLDKYRIEKLIGTGGMGVVVAAQHIHLKKRVAVKLLQAEAGQNVENLSRFLREAQLVAKMESQHVVRMLDVGTLDTGIPYMVMEYLEGQDLFEWMQERETRPVAQAVCFVQQACEAIAEAHALGIVHRDLKPGNLFCTVGPDGETTIKVLDFGISKVMATSEAEPLSELTQLHAVLGSPPYMSPEQTWSTRDVDERSDIWSLGVILYELLTGSLPFNGRTDLDLFIKITSRPPVSPRRRRPEIPRELELVVLKCLEKDRDQRYPSVSQLAAALRPFGPRPSAAASSRRPESRPAAGVFAIAAALALSLSGGSAPAGPEPSPGAARLRPPSADGGVPPPGTCSQSLGQPPDPSWFPAAATPPPHLIKPSHLESSPLSSY